jgi:hypothetical protein
MKKGAKVQVWLSSSEVQEWDTDETFRVQLRAELAKMARARGRRFAEAFDTAGKSLTVVEL